MDAYIGSQRIQDCGEQHHFIGKCRFHLTTFIDDVCISTVGAYIPQSGDNYETIGSDRFYETMVFRTDNDWSVREQGKVGEYSHPDIDNLWEDIAPDGLSSGYQTADEAANGHWEHSKYWMILHG